MNNNFSLDTLAVRGGYEIEKTTKSVEPPLYLTNAYIFDNCDEAASLFKLEKEGNIYSRLSNPTVDIFEKRIALMDEGVSAVAFSSGHAAIFGTMLNLCTSGDEILSSLNIYGGAVNLLGVTLKRLGINTKFIKIWDHEGFENSISDKTKCIFIETIGNPNADVADIEFFSNLAHKHNIPLIVDSTFTTPALIKPIKYGADFVVHSATKFLGGNGRVMGGVVVDSGNFVFKGNDKFPLYNEGDVSYHGLKYADFNENAFSVRLRSLIMRDIGSCLSPYNAHEFLQGLETLPLRMERMSKTALNIAKFLEDNEKVEKVNYPLLKSNVYYNLAKKYYKNGASSVFTFNLKGGKEDGIKFIDNLKLFLNCANMGDSKSLVIHPASTTHSQLNEEQLKEAQISSSTIRLSIGLEDENDLIDDLNNALNKI